MLKAPPLACQEMVELVTDYVEGAMSRRERRRFERHLSDCDGCSAYVEQMRETIALTGRLAPEDVPPQALEKLLHAFRGWHDAG